MLEVNKILIDHSSIMFQSLISPSDVTDSLKYDLILSYPAQYSASHLEAREV